LSKRAEWRKRLQRHRRSGLTVARFCEREGVSTASFYSWRKRLGGARTGGEGELPGFQPVRLTPAGVPMSIHLPGGVQVEVPMENLEGVRAVVGELMRHGTSGDVGGEAAASDAGGSPC
jgi:hypothetical protein